MLMTPPARLGGQQVVDGGEQIAIAPSSSFDDGDARRRMGHEDREQPVTPACHEAGTLCGQVGDRRDRSGLDGQLDAVHTYSTTWRGGSPTRSLSASSRSRTMRRAILSAEWTSHIAV